MNDPVFWQLGFVVLQEAFIATVAVTALVSLVRALLNGLNAAGTKKPGSCRVQATAIAAGRDVQGTLSPAPPYPAGG